MAEITNEALKAFADASESLAETSENMDKASGASGKASKGLGGILGDGLTTGFKSAMAPVSSAFLPMQFNQIYDMKNKIKAEILAKKDRKKDLARDKKSDERLRITAGIGKEEWKRLKKEQILLKDQKEYSEKQAEAFKSMVGLGDDITALSDKQIKTMQDGIAASKQQWLDEKSTQEESLAREIAAVKAGTVEMSEYALWAKKSELRKLEADTRAAAADRANRSLMEVMADGIKDTAKGIGGMAKKMGKGGLAAFGIIAAVLMAPIVALTAFFKQLAVEFKFLKSLTGGALGKIFAPLKALLNVKGFGWVGKLGITIKNVLITLKNFFTPVSNFFKTIMGLGRGLASTSKIAQGILTFASKFGTFMGKIFLPITILMSAFDFITGFMAGFKEGGIMGGLEGGLSKMFKGLIGMPLDLLKKGVAWILGVFGFDKAKEWLNAFSFSALIGDMISGMFDMIDKTVDWIMLLFSDPVAALKGLWTGILGGFKSLSELFMWPVNKVINWITGLFEWKALATEGWTNLSDFVGKTWTKVKTWFGSLLSWGTEKKEEGTSWIVTTIKTAVDAVKAWLGSMFKFDSASDILKTAFNIATFLPNMVFKGLTAVSSWLLGLFGFDKAAQDVANVGKFSLGDIVAKGLNAIIEWIGKLFNFDFMGWVTEKMGKVGKAGKWLLGKLGVGEKALGGPLQKGKPVLVGELGPELILPSGSGTVIPHQKTQSLLAAQDQNNNLTRQGASPPIQMNNLQQTINKSNSQVSKIGISAPTERPVGMFDTVALGAFN